MTETTEPKLAIEHRDQSIRSVLILVAEYQNQLSGTNHELTEEGC